MQDGQIYIYQLLGRDDGPKYVGYVVLNGTFLGIRFEGENPHKITADAVAFFEERLAERKAAIASREDGRRKAAETRAKKKG